MSRTAPEINLTNANLSSSILTSANLVGANLKNASLEDVVDLKLSQLFLRPTPSTTNGRCSQKDSTRWRRASRP
jgi:hypothetical protein